MIKYICFDLDDTLCNYSKAKKQAISKINKILEEELIDISSYWEEFNKISTIMFRQYVDKEISLEDYRINRFLNVISNGKSLNIDVVKIINEIYMNTANREIEFFDDVENYLKHIKSKGIDIAILTNGPSDGQRQKIKSLNLENYTNQIFISSEMGVAKPNKEYFKLVLNKLNCSKNEVVMIGDSINDDYLGARSMGIPSYLVNRFNQNINDDVLYINNLFEIDKYLNFN